MKQLQSYIIFILLLQFVACKKYVDVVPDKIATIDNAFTSRQQAEKFLFTCYSYMPKDADPNTNPAHTAGDEMIPLQSKWNTLGYMFGIARGTQNFVTPIGNDQYWVSMYKGLRDCNIFLENIGKVPGMIPTEKTNWIAEVKFLKAYYHFILLRAYGPVPLVKVNLPVDAPLEQTKVKRDPVDDCFGYIIQLLDEAKDSLPNIIQRQDMLGKINRPIAYAFKAKVLVTAASPLYNGNSDMASLKNKDGIQLFNQTYDASKWSVAATACKDAIDLCNSLGYHLYTADNTFQGISLTDTIRTQLSIRNSMAEKWNDEIIWANTQSWADGIQSVTPARWDPAMSDNTIVLNALDAPLKIAENFYTKNGVPVNEDKTYNYAQRYNLRTATAGEGLYVRQGFTSAILNFDREPRFYADLGFDGGIWYGQGKYDDTKPLDLFYISGRRGQINGVGNPNFGPVTGYSIKKCINFQNTMGSVRTYTVLNYPWPLIRLADLYLLYAEALNESNGPGATVYQYLNLVRQRAGIPDVETAWSDFSVTPAKYTTKEGLRSIIHQERSIELAFEGHKFWDMRRWKQAVQEYNAPLRGWDLYQEDAAAYYNPVTLYTQKFNLKDYFWPISEDELTANNNLVQNIGW